MPDDARIPDAEPASAPRYDFEAIDLDSGSTHADVVLLTGEDKRVLELGPATGYMSRAFRERGCTVVGVELDPEMAARAEEFCERVIVADLETIDWDAELGDERFDVIVAADVLEHLKDPLATLVALRERLAEDGCFVLSLPNVAHGSVRLALLGGSFDYQEIGLLDRTHLQFFTRASIERMLDAADLGLAVMHRHELNLDASEVPFDEGLVPAELRAALEADPDSRTYQFVVKAIPMSRPGLTALQQTLREAVEQRDDAVRELQQLRTANERLEARAGELERGFAEISGREGELRRSLIEAHDQLLRRDAELERARNSRAEELKEELEEQLEALRQELNAAVDNAGAQIEWRDEQIRRLQVRLDRIQNSPPAKLYAGLKEMPGVRTVVKRRTAGFEAQLHRGDRGGV